MAARLEQETTVTLGRDDEYVRIWTNNPVHARKLDADPRVQKLTSVQGETGEWGGDYRIAATDFDPLKGFRRRHTMTDEQKRAAADRLAKARQAKEQ